MLTLVVDDLDDALTVYTESLGFEKRSDEPVEMEGETGRWVTVAGPGDDVEIGFMLPDAPYDEDTRAAAAESLRGPVWWTFVTEDCEASVEALRAAGVEITQDPTDYPWGTDAMFVDPFGNEFALFERAETA